MPDKETLVSDAGKLSVLDGLLVKLKAEGHRVLIYSQMTRMIDLLEEYMNHRKHTYIRLVFKTLFFSNYRKRAIITKSCLETSLKTKKWSSKMG